MASFVGLAHQSVEIMDVLTTVMRFRVQTELFVWKELNCFDTVIPKLVTWGSCDILRDIATQCRFMKYYTAKWIFKSVQFLVGRFLSKI